MGRTGGKPPDNLEVDGRKFDLNQCWRFCELLRLAERNFLGTEPLPSGMTGGFTLSVPLRVWYVPATGVLARVEVRAPNQMEIVDRAQMLEQGLTDWYRLHRNKLSPEDIAKTQRLSEELKSLKTKLCREGSAIETKEAEERLATLEDWLGALGIHISK